MPPTTTVLFVDDDPRILTALQRVIRPSLGWDCEFALSGIDALDVLDRKPVDVLVADYHMPGMDGAALLAAVRSRYPSVVRVLLTGDVTILTAMRSLPVAHQALAKPFDPHELRQVLERVRAVRKLLDDTRFQGLAGGAETLPSLPQLVVELTALLEDPNHSIREVGQLVAKDPGAAARVLQLVNTPFFGLARPMTSIVDAVGYIGGARLRSLIVSVALVRAFPMELPDGVFSIERFQRRSVRRASLAAALMRDRHDIEEAYAAGLLSDVGRLVLASYAPGHLAGLVTRAREQGLSFEDAEERAGVVPSRHVGAYLLGLWGLPAWLVDAVARGASDAPPRPELLDPATALVMALHADTIVELGQPLTAETLRSGLPAVLRDGVANLDEVRRWIPLFERTLATA